jgi:hypothetical protein
MKNLTKLWKYDTETVLSVQSLAEVYILFRTYV